MTGPCIGALLSQIDTSIYGLPINADNAPGFMILVATFISFVQVSFGLMSLYLQLVILDVHANNTRVRLFYSSTAKAVSLASSGRMPISSAAMSISLIAIQLRPTRPRTMFFAARANIVTNERQNR